MSHEAHISRVFSYLVAKSRHKASHFELQQDPATSEARVVALPADAPDNLPELEAMSHAKGRQGWQVHKIIYSDGDNCEKTIWITGCVRDANTKYTSGPFPEHFELGRKFGVFRQYTGSFHAPFLGDALSLMKRHTQTCPSPDDVILMPLCLMQNTVFGFQRLHVIMAGIINNTLVLLDYQPALARFFYFDGLDTACEQHGLQIRRHYFSKQRDLVSCPFFTYATLKVLLNQGVPATSDELIAVLDKNVTAEYVEAHGDVPVSADFMIDYKCIQFPQTDRAAVVELSEDEEDGFVVVTTGPKS